MTIITRDRLRGARSSLAIKAPCRVATTVNIALYGIQTIDDVGLAAGDRVLVKNQTDQTENGVYIVATNTWQRSPDFKSTRDITQGTRVPVVQGTTGQGYWDVTTAGTIVVGTTNIVFEFVPDGSGGDVVVTGTAIDNQVAVFNSSNAIEGDSNFTWDGTSLDVIGDITVNGSSVINGSGAENQVTVWLDSDTIEGDANFTWDGSKLDVNGEAEANRYTEDVNTIGDFLGGTQDIDVSLGQVVEATVSTSTVTFTISNAAASGKSSSFTLVLTNGGSQTVNWPASVKWEGGTAPTLTSNGIDVIMMFTVDGGTSWYAFVAGYDMQ